jgi:excinuclease UvrABC helicase subunit UvrB
MEKAMYQCAQNMEFEAAAQLRDQILLLKEHLKMLPDA